MKKRIQFKRTPYGLLGTAVKSDWSPWLIFKHRVMKKPKRTILRPAWGMWKCIKKMSERGSWRTSNSARLKKLQLNIKPKARQSLKLEYTTTMGLWSSPWKETPSAIKDTTKTSKFRFRAKSKRQVFPQQWRKKEQKMSDLSAHQRIKKSSSQLKASFWKNWVRYSGSMGWRWSRTKKNVERYWVTTRAPTYERRELIYRSQIRPPDT